MRRRRNIQAEWQATQYPIAPGRRAAVASSLITASEVRVAMWNSGGIASAESHSARQTEPRSARRST